MENERPKVGVGIYIVNSQKQLLLMHRIGKHAYGTWAAPGGHLEYGETFLDCARREVKEETGIDIETIKVIGVENNIYKEEGKHYITPQLLAVKFNGEPQIMEPNKCDQMGWYYLDKLPSPLMPVLKDFLESDYGCLCGSGKKWLECHGK